MSELFEGKKIKTIVVDTLNAIQNNQYMGMLDKKTGMTRDTWRDFGVAIYAFMAEGLSARGFETVLILGREGTGKSFGIKYLEPGTNMWYNADKKNPTFRNVEFDGNTYKSREVYGTKLAPTKFMKISSSYEEILKHVDAIKKADKLDENPIAFLIGHIEDYKSENGEMRQRLKMLGNMASKMNIEGSVENCLYSRINVLGDNVEFKLDTTNSGTNTARSLESAFESRYIDNNFELIRKVISEY